jgi:hypothetical protein
MANHDDKSDSGTQIDLRLPSGRPLWCWQYLVSYTYANFMVRTPSERCNEIMLASVEREAKRFFGEWPVHVIQPVRRQGEIDYPRVRITAFFTSMPMQPEMHLSSLVVVWFQDSQSPVPGEGAKASLMGIEWERLALDYET